jgi:2-keto-4-pentenoate hydratase/2-oxohepta-3-ene-1,7-dioic acid hydratase in catechol pathway
MSTSVLRTAAAWRAVTHTGAVRVATRATTTAGLLADREAIAPAAASTGTVPAHGLPLISPVTPSCRVVAQMTNFASHVTDTGGNPAAVSLTFFAGLVVPNDISARDIQLSQTQFYEAKSYPDFAPCGPALVLLDPGDLVLTGTPVGTALSAAPRPVRLLASFPPDRVKWQLFFRGQARDPRCLQDGDLIEASVATDDGAIALGVQHTVVRYPC